MLLEDAGNDVNKAQANIEQWFNDAMERVSGWYKRKAQLILFGLALVVSFGLNADTIMTGNRLIRDTTLRASVIAAAQEITQKSQPDTVGGKPAGYKELNVQLQQLGLPIGWDRAAADRWFPKDRAGWLNKILGLLLTTIAVSLGSVLV